MPCSGPARELTAKAASAASAHWRACAGGPLRISHQLAAEALVIGDRRFDKFTGFEPALAKQYRDLGDRTQKWIGHDDIPPSRHLIPRYNAIRSEPSLRRGVDFGPD